MNRLLILFVLLAGIFCAVSAQDTDGMVGVGFKGGVATYFGDVDQQKIKPHFGLTMY